MADLNSLESSQSVKIAGSDESGIETNFVNSTTAGQLKVINEVEQGVNNPIYDSYARQRVVTPQTIYAATFVYDLRPLVTTNFTANGGTLTRVASRSSARLSVTTANGSRSTFQSREYIHYVPGQTFEIYVAAQFSANSANRVQRAGCFDNSNGAFFEYENGTMYAVIRTSTSGSPVDSRVAQSNWNIDKLDGTGVSGITLDPTKIQNFLIFYQWNGAGPVTYAFRVGGKIVPVHVDNNANIESVPWASTGDFPIRAEVINTSAAANTADLDIQCFACSSAGASFRSTQTHGILRSNSRAINNSTYSPVISLRLKSAYNRAQIIIGDTPTISETSDNLELQIVYNGTLTGASWVDVPGQSIAQYDESATSISGGDVIFSFYVAQNDKAGFKDLNSLLKLVSDYAGTSDIVTITCRSLDTGADVRAGFTFQEIF